jgi:hypothetical protein
MKNAVNKAAEAEETLTMLREYAERVASRIDDRKPSLRGRCVEVSLLVRAIFGGSLVGRTVPCDCEPDCEGTNHYWNRLPDGREFDLTSNQFGGDGIHQYFKGGEVQDTPSMTALEKLAFIALVAEEMPKWTIV